MTDKDEFKRWISGVFSRSSKSYDHVGPEFFSYFGNRLVEIALIPKGSSVLDVACGRGAVLLPVSSVVGETGKVIGIDISDGMIEEISRDISHLGLSNTRVFKMDAEALEFPVGTFDFVLCGLSLFFFPRLEQALAGFIRVLKPGGYFVTSTFEEVETEMKERFRDLTEGYKDHLKPVPLVETNDLDTVEEMEQVLSQAGFVDIQISMETKTFYYRDESEWWEGQWSHGRRALLERMGEEILEKYKDDAFKIIRECLSEKGIPTTFSVLYSKGRKSTETVKAT